MIVMQLESLKSWIAAEGWMDFGIVSFQALKSHLEKHQLRFEEWFEKGFAGTMDYLKTMEQDRFHPDRKLSGIKSVIVLSAWYGKEPLASDLKTQGQVARYAGGRDYHKVLKKKLLKLADFLKESFPDSQTYASVDSGPTVDRALAELAGLGFFGKNSNLINPRKGSYFFIASLMTTADLPLTPHQAMPTCGSCHSCIDACPTGAITAPGMIDARKCISYLTIENKEGIPEALRGKIGNRIFGCDICQEVCPFNIGRASKQEVRIENLKGYYGAGHTLDLKEVLSLSTDDEFKKRFEGTPLMRSKRRGLIRNACVVAGNSRNPDLIPFLKTVFDREADAMLREHAAWALKKLENLIK